MDPLLTEYAALYKLAFADVADAFGRPKVAANPKADLVRKGINAVDDFGTRYFGTSPRAGYGAAADAGADTVFDATAALGKKVDAPASPAEEALKAMREGHSMRQGHSAAEAAELAAQQARAGEVAGYTQRMQGMQPQIDSMLSEAGMDPAVVARARKMQADEAAAAAVQKSAPEAGANVAPGKAVSEAAGEAAGEAGGNGVRNTLLAGTGIAGAGLAGHQYGAMKEEERGIRNRNLAFGAGAAAGIAAPGLVRNVGQTMQGLSNLAGARPPSAPRPHAPARPGGLSPQQAMMMRQRGY